MREKLIELLDVIIQPGQKTLGDIADHLIANGVTIQKWIPVSERLPQSGKCVLLHSKSGAVSEGRYSAFDKKWVQFRWSVKDLEVTHWMPLP